MEKLTISPLPIVAMALTILLLFGLLLVWSVPNKDSPAGFVLPPGNSEQGQAAFVKHGCTQCHKVDGVQLSASPTVEPGLVVRLGGEYPVARTYGQLVTAIIHPSESITGQREAYVDEDGQSRMPDYARTLTVQELTDLVAFLHPRYDVLMPQYDTRMLYTHP